MDINSKTGVQYLGKLENAEKCNLIFNEGVYLCALGKDQVIFKQGDGVHKFQELEILTVIDDTFRKLMDRLEMWLLEDGRWKNFDQICMTNAKGETVTFKMR